LAFINTDIVALESHRLHNG